MKLSYKDTLFETSSKHHSLAYWKYHTKDRKTGKAYSWNNQTKDDVEKWLASNHSLNIKKVEMI
jgi:hypothetical protein